MSDEGRKKTRRSYSPAVEAMEALRLFSGAAPTLPDLSAEHGAFLDSAHLGGARLDETWDAALVDSQVSDLLAPSRLDVDAGAIQSGLAQLDRYLGRVWYRAGIPPQQHDDCSQAVYAILLENLDRDGFDRLAGDVGQAGIRDVLSRETPEGPDFFRAIDTVKKRAQRQRNFQPLELAGEVPSAESEGVATGWRDTLEEAIVVALSPIEAALIYATLKGETPAEIASRRGVAPKTISNEKTRVLKKLRDFLVADRAD